MERGRQMKKKKKKKKNNYQKRQKKHCVPRNFSLNRPCQARIPFNMTRSRKFAQVLQANSNVRLKKKNFWHGLKYEAKLIRVSCDSAKKSIESASFQNPQNVFFKADSDWFLWTSGDISRLQNTSSRNGSKMLPQPCRPCIFARVAC